MAHGFSSEAQPAFPYQYVPQMIVGNGDGGYGNITPESLYPSPARMGHTTRDFQFPEVTKSFPPSYEHIGFSAAADEEGPADGLYLPRYSDGLSGVKSPIDDGIAVKNAIISASAENPTTPKNHKSYLPDVFKGDDDGNDDDDHSVGNDDDDQRPFTDGLFVSPSPLTPPLSSIKPREVRSSAAVSRLKGRLPITSPSPRRLKAPRTKLMKQHNLLLPTPRASQDPENHEIKRLRETERLPWAVIATRLNEARVEDGKVPCLTDHAVYSRYTRNARAIAQANGEKDWKCRRLDGYGRRSVSMMSSKPDLDDAGGSSGSGAGESSKAADSAAAAAAADRQANTEGGPIMSSEGNTNDKSSNSGGKGDGVRGKTTTTATTTQPKASLSPPPTWTSDRDDLLVRAYDEARHETWTRVAEKLEQWTDGDVSVSREECAYRYGML
ncbi:MAG: hypothetical protein M1837_006870 [Sclerophora amabilis]|nr:MAG: hypothetical protein M1837_006870 [Sclerophora amabilis]